MPIDLCRVIQNPKPGSLSGRTTRVQAITTWATNSAATIQCSACAVAV